MRQPTRFACCAILLAFVSLPSFGQKKVLIRSNFKPNKKYETVSVTNATSKIDFKGDEQTLNQIRATGTQIPTTMVVLSEITTMSATGTTQADKSIPVTIEFGKAVSKQTMNGTDREQPDLISGLIMKGSFNSSNILKIDTLISTQLTQEMKNLVRSSLESVLKHVSFPATPMAIGDVFDQKVPSKLPLGNGTAVNMVVTTRYKLKSIENNTAIFDLTLVSAIDESTSQANVKASGTGTGLLKFDLATDIVSAYDSNMDMIMDMQMEGLNMNLIIKSVSSQTTKLEK